MIELGKGKMVYSLLTIAAVVGRGDKTLTWEIGTFYTPAFSSQGYCYTSWSGNTCTPWVNMGCREAEEKDQAQTQLLLDLVLLAQLPAIGCIK